LAKAKGKKKGGGGRKGRKKGGRRSPRSIPILPVLGVGIPVLNAANIAQSSGGIAGPWGPSGSMGAKLYGFLVGMGLQTVGFNASNGQFTTKYLSWFWGPVIIGGLGHKFAGYLGINKVFARHKLPFSL